MEFKNFWIQYKVNNLPYEAQILTETFIIGRSPECDLTIVSEVVSRKHLKVEFQDNKILVQDLGSTNGTFIDGELLKPNTKYEYKTGDKLYIDVKKQVVLRITALFNKAQIDIEMDEQKLLLEKKKFELKNRSNKFSQKDDFINHATEKVDNLFENILFVAKSARFNKEKAIKEAEYQSDEMIEKARKEIEKERSDLENQLKALQEETINEAKRTINSAHSKSKKIISQAEEAAREQSKKIEAEKQEALEELRLQKQNIINQAQEKHSEIIGEAFLKNKELKDENVKLQNEIFENKQSAQIAKKDIAFLMSEKENYDKQFQKSKVTYEEELVNLNALKSRISQLEVKGEAALKVLNIEIPEKEKHLEDLKDELLLSKNQYQAELAQLDQIQDDIARCQDQLKKDEEKAIRSEQRVDELSDKITESEDNLFRLTKIKQQRNEEIEKEISERKERQRLLEEEVSAKFESRKAKVTKEIEVNLSKAKELASNLVMDAKSEAAQLLQKAKEEAIDLSKDLRKEAEALLIDTKRETDELRARTKGEAEALYSKAQKDTEALRETVKKETDKLRETTKRETDEIRSNLKEYIDREKNQVIEDAKAKANNILEKVQSEKRDLLEKYKETQKKLYEDLNLEIIEKKKATELEIQSIRSNAVNMIEEQRKNMLKEEEQKNNIRVIRLRKELNDVLRARINPFLREASHLEKVSTILEKSINAIMLDEVDNDFIETENYSDFDPTIQQNKVKKFWRYSGVSALIVTLVVIFMPDFKEAAVQSSRNIAAKADQETKAQIEQAQKINDLSKEFHPEIKEEYLESYTDRVLYTRAYVETELEKKYREQWIIDLQEYFVHTLRLDENNLVPFIAQEANLVRELDEAKKSINGNFIKEGVAKMEEIESAFIKKIKENIKSKKDFDKIMNFKKEFFLKNRKPEDGSSG